MLFGMPLQVDSYVVVVASAVVVVTSIFGSPAAIAVPLDEGHVGAVRYARQPQSEKIVGQ